MRGIFDGRVIGSATSFIALVALEQRDQMPYPQARHVTVGYMHPLHLTKPIGHPRGCFFGVIDDCGHQESRIVIHHLRAVDCKLPLQSEVAFPSVLCVGGNDGDEKCAVIDLPADFPIPLIAAAQLTLVEPHFNTRSDQRLSNTPCCGQVFRRVAQKDGS
jgi:hypothetical protein